MATPNKLLFESHPRGQPTPENGSARKNCGTGEVAFPFTGKAKEVAGPEGASAEVVTMTTIRTMTAMTSMTMMITRTMTTLGK